MNVLEEINKKYGKGKAIIGTEYRLHTPIIASTGSLALDIAIACGGLPEGRLFEYFGKESGGKTTLSIISMIEVQKKGYNVAFIDAEKTFDRSWFEKLGGDSSKLIYIKPDKGDEVFDICEMLVNSNIEAVKKFNEKKITQEELNKEVFLIVIDSVSAMMTNAEKEAAYSDSTMAQLARLMSSGLKKLNNAVGNSRCSIIFINQIRSGIGTYTSPIQTTGGNALKFYTSIRLYINKGEVIGEEDNPAGFLTKIDVKKNKCGPPLRKVITNLYIGTDGRYGINKEEEVIDIALFKNIIKRVKKDKDENGNEIWIESDSGKSYKYKEFVAIGKQNFINTLLQNKEKFEELKQEIFKIFVEQDVPEEGSYNEAVNEEILEQEIEEEIKKVRKERKKKNEETDKPE